LGRIKKIPFLATFLFCTAADIGSTLLGQSAKYWAGHYQAAVEYNPIFAPALRHHPITFILAALFATVIFLCLVHLFPKRLTAAVMFLGAIVHLVGAGSWLFDFGIVGIIGIIVIFGLARLLTEIEWSGAWFDVGDGGVGAGADTLLGP
jgi:hypothetical protein